MTKIAILVLNYNGKRYLAGFLSAAGFLENEPTAEVVIVDNASCDDSLEFVRKNYPWVKIVRNDSNYGWGEGYNKGIATLLACDHVYTHYMFINNDVFPNQDWYTRLLSAVEAAPPETGEIGCRTVFAAPFVMEDVVSVVRGRRSQLAWRFASRSDHDVLHVGIGGGKLLATVRAAAESRPTPAHLSRFLTGPERDAESQYGLIIENTSSSPAELELAPHLGLLRSVSIAGDFSLAVLHKGAGERRLVVDAKSRVVLLRLVMTGEPLRYLIQNSGIGLNANFEGYDLHTYEAHDTPQNALSVSGICGVCKIVTREAFESVGGFDARYFMYYEDLDFSLKLKAKGFKALLVHDAILRHVHAGSSKSRSTFFERQVTWSRYYFQFLHGGIFRRVKTWVSFLFYASIENRSDFHRMSAPHVIALDKFRSALSGRAYVLGPRRTES